MRIPQDRRTLLACAAAGVIVAGGWFGLLSPALSDHASIAAQRATLESANEQMKARLPALQSQLADIAPRVDELRALGARVPAAIDQPALLQEMQAMAAASGMEAAHNVAIGLPTMVEVNPGAAAPLPGPGPADDPLSAADLPEQKAVIASHSVQIEVRGSEAQVRDFLVNVQNSSRLVIVNTSGLQVAKDGTATMRISATYFLQQVDVDGLASQIEALVARGHGGQGGAPAAGAEASPED